jgi:hypothetical protein
MSVASDRDARQTNAETTDQSKTAKLADSATSAASDVASSATSGAKDVAGEAATQAKAVVGETKRQVSNVVDQTRHELTKQADERTRQAAGGLRTLSDQVSALTEGRPGDAGPLAGYLEDARARVTTFADRLDQGGPQGLLDDVTSFARRRPIAFLAATGAAGFLAGRLARAGRAVQHDDGGPAALGSTSTPALAAPPVLPDDDIGVGVMAATAPDAPVITTAP